MFLDGIMSTCGVCHFKNLMANPLKKEIIISELPPLLPFFVNTFALLDCLKQNTNIP